MPGAYPGEHKGSSLGMPGVYPGEHKGSSPGVPGVYFGAVAALGRGTNAENC